jgi:RNA polymerase sigma-70 factor (ECF subfamily)
MPCEPAARKRGGVSCTSVYTPVVYGWARQAGLQPSDAADVVQEVFRAVFASIASFRSDSPGDTFQGWLWTITRNKIRDWRRRAVRQPEAPGGTDFLQRIEQLPQELSTSASEPFARQSLIQQTLDLVRSEVEPTTWQAFSLMVLEDRPARDVAQQLGMKIGAVYTIKSRVLKRLRECLAEL